ncbi:MAG: hypothetical protein J6V89_05465 [Acetobacter sp.]|nr:hypothetical protein [Acetobacter sp.]
MTENIQSPRNAREEALMKLYDIVLGDVPLKEKPKALYQHYKSTKDVLPWYQVMVALLVIPWEFIKGFSGICGFVLMILALPLVCFYIDHPTMSLFTYQGLMTYKHEIWDIWHGMFSLP